jgi:hypothetical protein
MAEEGVVRHPVCHGRVERCQIVDPLAGVAALPEQVLVDVGDRGGIWVDAGRPGEGPPEDRHVVLGRESRRDPRLQNAVAVGHPADVWVEGRLVKRMCDRAHEATHRTAGQPSIGIERDHIPHVGRRGRRRASGHDAGRQRPTQERVQLVQLAALPLPTHPAALGLVPRPASVEEQEPRVTIGGLPVALVQPVDPGGGRRKDLVVARNALGRGVEPVR